MNIITEKMKIGRIQDGISTILKSDDTTFGKILQRLNPSQNVDEEFKFYYATDKCELPDNKIQLGLEERTDSSSNIIMRGYYASGARISVSELFKLLAKLKDAFPEGSPEKGRIDRLLVTRNLNSFKLFFTNQYKQLGIDDRIVDKTFEILSDKELLIIENILIKDMNLKDHFAYMIQ